MNSPSIFEERPRSGPCPQHLRIPVTIVGYIDYARGADDGTDQEFSVNRWSGCRSSHPTTPVGGSSG